MKLFHIVVSIGLVFLLTACLGGKKLIEKDVVVKKDLANQDKTTTAPSGNIYNKKSSTKPVDLVNEKTSTLASNTQNPTERVSEDRAVVIPLDKANSLKNANLDGHERKASFQKKSICEMQPLSDWHYSFSDHAPSTFKECNTYPPESNFERYLKRQKIHDVGELSRKIVHKNLKGVLKHAVKTGEIMSKVCFNRKGEVVASKVLECSINYTRDRLEGYQDALLEYRWSGNRSAPPVECMKIFFSTSLQ